MLFFAKICKADSRCAGGDFARNGRDSAFRGGVRPPYGIIYCMGGGCRLKENFEGGERDDRIETDVKGQSGGDNLA